MPKIRLYSKPWIYALVLFLSVALCLFIFIMSCEPADVSSERSSGIADVIAQIFVEDFDILAKDEKEEVLLSIEHIIRKIVHFCMYATLGALFAFSSLWHSRTWAKHFLLPWTLSALYAASDEFHQMFVPGRGPLVSDVVLDSFGAACGVTFALLCTLLALKRKS